MEIEDTKFKVVINIVIILSTIISLIQNTIIFTILTIILYFTILIYSALKEVQDRDLQLFFGIGKANLITITRGFIFLGLLIIRNYLLNIWFALFVLAILLVDIIDGYVARNFDAVTNSGQILDIEIDSAITLLLSLMVSLYTTIPKWIISIGLLRYFYNIILSFFKNKKEADRRSIFAIVASISFDISLCLIWVFDILILGYMIQLLSIAIIISFIRDFRYRLV